MAKDKMPITVVIAAYARPDLLRLAMQSVLAQTYRDFRLVVLDDASPEELLPVVESFDDPRVQYVRNAENLGINRNMRKAFEMADEGYLIVFADDDLLAPTLLERCVGALDSHPEAFVAAALSNLIDESGAVLGPSGPADVPHLPECVSPERFLDVYFVRFPPVRLYIASMLFRVEVLREHALSYPDEGFARGSDDWFLAELALTGRSVCIVPERLYLRRVHLAMNTLASPAVVAEMMRAAEKAQQDARLRQAGWKERLVDFFVRAALESIREMPLGQGTRELAYVREQARRSGIDMKGVLSRMGWKGRLEFTSATSMRLVRSARRARHGRQSQEGSAA